ncbi:hypothetical protein STSO111631_07640 [Stackebrandtia soli]
MIQRQRTPISTRSKWIAIAIVVTVWLAIVILAVTMGAR